jgi:thiamine-monophosphate kinase
MTQPDNSRSNAESQGSDTVGSVHELAVLSRIFPLLPQADAALLGPGDDAAVIAAPDGRFVVTTDMMVHGPDFRLAWSTPHDLGWKAAATNLADVAAMGARPTALVVAIAATRDTPVTALEEIAAGLRDACAELAPGCGVVGGDMSVSDTFTLAITAFGDLESRAPVTRSGARVGDVIALCGDAGVAATGLRLLFSEAVDANGNPERSAAERLRREHPVAIDAQLAPRPPISSGVSAARAGATAMLDVSDGLALDARRIAEASGVTLDLHASLLGTDPEAALRGGEDHALLATFGSIESLPTGFRPIGRVTDGGGSVTLDGAPIAGVLGWDPYEGWNGRAG